MPISLETIEYGTKGKVQEIKNWLDLFKKGNYKHWKELGFTWEEIKTWIKIGLKKDEYALANYLKNKKKITCQEANSFSHDRLEELRLACEEFLTSELSKEKINDLVQQWRSKVEQIPYEQLENIEHLADGGFSKVYRAEWKQQDVVLKQLYNSQNITDEFLQEIAKHKLLGDENIVKCYGISQDSNGNYIMIMELIQGGNLREHLQNEHNKLDFKKKLIQLHSIAEGLNSIHKRGLIHHDFHLGNILSKGPGSFFADLKCYITDFGLNRPANYQKQEGETFGVLPYVAPEVLQGAPYTQASDIYSFGIIAYELLANSFPYYDTPHRNWDNDEKIKKELIEEIIKNELRPNIGKIKIPQLLKDLIKRCWGADPNKRPNARELEKTIDNWQDEFRKNKKDTEFIRQFQAIELEYNQIILNIPYQFSSLAVVHSKLINTKQIAQLFQESKEQALKEEIKKLEKEIKQPLELVSDFIQTHKRRLKDRKDKEVRNKFKELREKLKDQGLSEENIEKLIKYCERFIKAGQQLELETNIEIPTNN